MCVALSANCIVQQQNMKTYILEYFICILIYKMRSLNFLRLTF